MVVNNTMFSLHNKISVNEQNLCLFEQDVLIANKICRYLNNIMSQLNITLLLEPSSKPQSIAGSTRKKLESQVVSKISHVLALFNTRIRIELIVIETPENVIQALANGLHLEMDEQLFNSNWAQCMEKINNLKYLIFYVFFNT